MNTCVEAEAQRAVRCSTEPRAALGCVRFAVRFVSLVLASCQLQLQTCTLMLNNVLSKNIKCEKYEIFVEVGLVNICCYSQHSLHMNVLQ